MKQNVTPQKSKLTIEQIEAALKAASGNISYAARALGVSRTAIYRRIEDSPTLQALLVDVREELVDIAESALKREVLNQNITAIIFTLKTQGQKRGYIERIQHVFMSPEQAERFDELAKQFGRPASALFEDMMNALADELPGTGDEGGAQDTTGASPAQQ